MAEERLHLHCHRPSVAAAVAPHRLPWLPVEVPVLPIFPLGSVLLPHMPLALRIFEPRFLKMLGDLLEQPVPEFGVVLIERGHEVGGGDVRFTIGTVARLLSVDPQEGYVGVVARGGRRFQVTRWLEEQPYPQAEAEFLDDLGWDPDQDSQWHATHRIVTLALARANDVTTEELGPLPLSEDRVQASWQLAGFAPLGPLDKINLLQSETVQDLLSATDRLTAEALDLFEWPDT